MKKTFRKVALFAGIVVATSSLSSCQTVATLATNQQVRQVVSTLLTNYVAGQGTTSVYNGKLSSQLLKKSGENYTTVNAKGTFATQAANVTIVAGQTATITVPAQTIDGAAMSDVALGNLIIAKNGTTNTITVGDNTTANGTITVNGTAYNISGAYLDACSYTDAGEFDGGTIQFYFGPNKEFVANLKFSGKKQ